MKINESLLAALIGIERVLVRHSEGDDCPPYADKPEYSVRRAIRSEFREKRERLLDGIDSDVRTVHWVIARAEAESAEWRAYAASLARSEAPITTGAQLTLDVVAGHDRAAGGSR